MNLPTFFEELKKTKKNYNWYINSYDECIRAQKKNNVSNDDFCPITCVYNRLTKKYKYTGNYDEAGKEIGLLDKTAEKIANAADSDLKETKKLRNKMLKILGLKN